VNEAPDAGVPASLCRLFRTDVIDPFAAGFELRQIILGDSFPHYVHAGFWANRLPIDDRRRSLAGRVIEAFSAKDYSHGRSS
jgi:hypothetical protein